MNRNSVQHTGAKGATNGYSPALSSNQGAQQLPKVAEQISSSPNQEHLSESGALTFYHLR